VNHKARTILQAIAAHAPAGAIVEIGSTRSHDEIPSDGFSTVYLAYIAAASGREFDSVDTDLNAVTIARELTADTAARVHLEDGTEFLRCYPDPIGVLYLDGALDPAETLAQYQAAAMVETGALVLIDDAQPAGDQLEHGKATGVTSHLKQDGFRVAIRDTEPGYQMVVAWR
jgi:predicted O-methyltransferase YrrM